MQNNEKFRLATLVMRVKYIPIAYSKKVYELSNKDIFGSPRENPNFMYMIIDTWRDIPSLLVSPFWEDRVMASYALAKETAKTAYAFLSREWVPASNDTLSF